MKILAPVTLLIFIVLTWIVRQEHFRMSPFDPWGIHEAPKFQSNAAVVPVEDRKGSPCYQAYRRLFQGEELDVRVIFGYKDARPARFVGDLYERVAFVERILQPCRAGFACGFQRDPEDGNLFHREIRGPDGERVKVRLLVSHSSAGADDEENRKDPRQNWLSFRAEMEFLMGLEVADVVFYYGHSRDGGGPDFEPPRLGSDGHPMYWWYERRKPGLKKMVTALQANPRTPKILGLFSCVSKGLFSKAIRKAQPGAGLISSSKLLYFTDALGIMAKALSAVLGMRCESDFEDALRLDATRSGSDMVGFFRTQAGG